MGWQQGGKLLDHLQPIVILTAGHISHTFHRFVVSPHNGLLETLDDQEWPTIDFILVALIHLNTEPGVGSSGNTRAKLEHHIISHAHGKLTCK